jgi:hypothetical protein
MAQGKRGRNETQRVCLHEYATSGRDRDLDAGPLGSSADCAFTAVAAPLPHQRDHGRPWSARPHRPLLPEGRHGGAPARHSLVVRHDAGAAGSQRPQPRQLEAVGAAAQPSLQRDLGPEQAYCILGRNAAGEVVATQAGRLFSWPDTSFYEEARSLRLFYDDPARQALPREVCDVTAMATKAVSGRVVFSGGGWYRPDYRKRWLAAILPRISRAYAYTRWHTDFTTTVMDKGVFDGGFGRRAGYTNADWVLDWRNTPLGDMYLGFLWMDPGQLLGDLREFLKSFDAQVDAVVDHRRAQHG